MKDTGNAAFFPKKRDREESSSNNNVPVSNKDSINDDDSLIPEVEAGLADYIDQMGSKFPEVQSFYDSLSEEMQELSQQWDVLQSEVTLATEHQHQRENEVEVEGMVTLVVPVNHLYIEQLALIRKFGTRCDEIDQFIAGINQWIDFSNKRIASIKGYLKNASPPYVLAMVANATAMEGMKMRMCSHTAFIKGEMTGIKNVYTKGDADFQKDIREKLSDKPELLAWAMPFFNPDEDENADILQSALNTLKPSKSK